MTNSPDHFHTLAMAASNHLRISHTALTNQYRAEELLNDRMLDFMQDHLDGDEKSPEVDAACAAINGLPGPMISIRMRQAASQRIADIRHER